MNALAHRLTSGSVLSILSLGLPTEEPQRLPQTIAVGCAGFTLGTLPDLFEPATSPNHRRFFHSLTFAALLGVGAYKLYHWQPETDADKLLRALGLVGIGAYLIHLAMDATTAKSLPLI